ncbi:PEGA domain-containing protein [Candidatus Uhrbacteria bacterium]|nr:PEGA domain-containing protein [Candidatus Uhrbacteria bacterium]
MHAVPFHRRIFPWIIAIAFIAMAPAVVFYTSGYRYDSKRGKVERYGTIIIDSQPSGAKLRIDGRSTNKLTPITIQDMAPGSHSIELQLDGYFDWKKKLDITPERVTFVDHVQLWSKNQPNFLFQTPDTGFFSSPKGSRILLTNASGTAQALQFTNIPSFRLSSTTPLSASIPLDSFVHWSDDDRYALVESSSGTTDLIDATNVTKSLQLPEGNYRWDGKMVVGTNENSLVNITRNGTLSRNPLLQNQVDVLDDVVLQEIENHSSFILTAQDQPGKGYVLPKGNWRFWQKHGDILILRDGSRWLSLNRVSGSESYHSSEATGKTLQILNQKKNDLALLVTENELWLWDFLTPPELLYRQSNSLVDAFWHTSGNYIFIATHTTLSVIELDPRDGRIWTDLAKFDQINGISYYNNQVLILGENEGKRGLWNLKVTSS